MLAVILVFKILKYVVSIKSYLSFRSRPNSRNRLRRKNQQHLIFSKLSNSCNFWMHTETKHVLAASLSSSEKYKWVLQFFVCEISRLLNFAFQNSEKFCSETFWKLQSPRTLWPLDLIVAKYFRCTEFCLTGGAPVAPGATRSRPRWTVYIKILRMTPGPNPEIG